VCECDLHKASRDDSVHTEQVNDFALQNPASKKLYDELERSYDIMIENLMKEVEKILDPKNS
jgi:hypothetical protein